MKHATEYLTFETPHRRDYVNITDRVEAFVRESGIQHGLVLVNPMHITAAVYVNDDESGLIQDIDDWLERLAPHEPVSGYRHNRGEDNADAHLKRQLMAHQVVLPITDGRLDLGPVGAGLLRRVRRPAPQARRAQGDRRVSLRDRLRGQRARRRSRPPTLLAYGGRTATPTTCSSSCRAGSRRVRGLERVRAPDLRATSCSSLRKGYASERGAASGTGAVRARARLARPRRQAAADPAYG